ncbi:NAD(P)-dependent oxidoreductase [Cohnella ginsengisoli]|uniref:NAD(P)-dependent oxidoreductase n=1 Tax=Cohnella ginsengisoli TaxID=425004 RepID=A0A9X4KGR8_9BACL|nr:NAD(P)-dependent oxidoreductase [Cohnella ginsengisoli]MDG0789435.1 NAD(P)-dependent oxidoreductase [Cohnella ginsengisoli]
MNILITGASGSVGTGAAEVLSANHRIRLSDAVPINSPHPFWSADVREPNSLLEATEGVEVIIHTPAFHGVHLGQRTEQEFYDLNVTGTFHMFQAAVRNRVRRVVWLSSMSIYGSSFYSYTKKIGEQLCQFYHENHGIEIIMLRPADFTPYRDIFHYGERMLHGGVDRRDIIQAVECAVSCKTPFGAYHIVRQDPFDEQDVRVYSEFPLEVWEKAYPGSKDFITKQGFRIPQQIQVTDLSKERQELGFSPRYNFGTFMKEYDSNTT